MSPIQKNKIKESIEQSSSPYENFSLPKISGLNIPPKEKDTLGTRFNMR